MKVALNESASQVIRFGLVFTSLRHDLQGQIQGQRKGNALAPKVPVPFTQKWSQTIPQSRFQFDRGIQVNRL